MALILQSLPDNDVPLVFVGVVDVRPARAGPSQYAFKAEFVEKNAAHVPPPLRKTYFAWVNLAFLPMFLPGSEWQNKQKIRDSGIKFKRIGPIMGADFTLTADVRAGFRADNLRRASEIIDRCPTPNLTAHKRFRFGPHLFTEQPSAYGLQTSEVVRFYVAAFGSIFYELNSALAASDPLSPDTLIDELVYRDRCTWIDDVTLKIAPKSGLTDRISAAQVALLMTDAEVYKSVLFIARALNAQAKYEADSALLGILPQDRKGGLDCETGDPVDYVTNGGAIQKMIPIRKIKRDNRKFPFSRLVIEVSDLEPRSSYNKITNPDGEIIEVPIFGADIVVSDKLASSGNTRRLADFGPSFSDCFPDMSNITFRMEGRARGTAQRRRLATAKKEVVSTRVTLSRTRSSEGVPSLGKSDNSYMPELDSFSERALQPLPAFPWATPPGEVSIEYVPRQLLGNRLQTFAKARTLMIQEGVVRPIFDGEGSELEPVVVPPANWGSFAYSRKYGARRMSVMSIPTEIGRVFYAMELGQLVPGEYAAMAVLSRQDGNEMSMADIFAVLYHTCRTGQRHGSTASSIWPIHYADLDVAPLIHHSKLYRPTALRQAILSAINGLVARRYRSSTFGVAVS